MQETTIDRSVPDPLETLIVTLAAASRYDVLLGIIPVAYASAILVAGLSSVPLVLTMLVASLVGVVVIVDACYLNPLTEARS
ncbi:hypothetical protein SAMN04487967_1274 [Natronorubrum sediminis]|uniref:Uncharacterized protein n=1 Tax=Natronorubrum sediminis TaxID=640943 RepID=A0A1H6FSR1_9EURY|nr:hypothetical protein [Natronorubrum sediminis]SEH13290.1 hypothetical protein SAMN04487967_1274 [Natronorubrum sediminis]